MLNRRKKPAPTRAKRSLGERIRRWWRILKWSTVACTVLVVIGWYYVHHLGKWGEARFSRSFRWDVPSRIYSDVEYLYPGLDVRARGLQDKLDRLGYRNASTAVHAPGDYAFVTEDLLIYLHDFEYPLEKFAGFPIRIHLLGGRIEQMTRLDTHETLPTVRLEPELIASVFDARMEDRTLVRLQEVPDACLQAVVLIEDERFFRHHGVDPIGIARAMWTNLIRMRFVQGGSTLTQQLVKNYFLTSERKLKRKIKEALLALALEARHSKREILEAYVNEIYLGQRGSGNVYGFGEAARLYFAKNIDQLSAGECALLAGMIRAPHRYSPFRDVGNATQRRDFVLARLHDATLLTNPDYQAAVAEPLITPKQPHRVVHAPYFIDFVKHQLYELYPEEQLSSEGLRIFTTMDMTNQRIAEAAVTQGLTQLETQWKNILPKDHADPLQGVLISLQPQTGYIRALVGGRDYATSKFNRAFQAQRQPGSIFKPFVYLTAFDTKRTTAAIAPASIIHDVSFTVPSGGESWTPSNYDKKQHGAITAHEALIKSYNIATAQLGIDVGLDNVVQTARDAGLSSELQPVPAMSLGAFEVSPLEMAAAYTIFANNGIRTEPLSIIHVATRDGQVLERKSLRMERRFDPGPVFLVTQVLKDVFEHGTAAGARKLGFTGLAAGKTGTTSSYRDAWFVGFTPDLLTLTWVGYDDNATTNMSGGRAALPLWVDYMRQAVGSAQQDFPVPSSVVLVKIDPISGKVWTKGCPEATFAPFVEGSEPTEYCPLHGEPERGLFRKVRRGRQDFSHRK